MRSIIGLFCVASSALAQLPAIDTNIIPPLQDATTEVYEYCANDAYEDDELNISEADRILQQHFDSNEGATPEGAAFAFDEEVFAALIPLSGMSQDNIRISSDVPGVLSIKFQRANATTSSEDGDYEVNLESFGANPEDILAELVLDENILVVSVPTYVQEGHLPNAATFEAGSVVIHHRDHLSDLVSMQSVIPDSADSLVVPKLEL